MSEQSLVSICVPVWNRIWCIDGFFKSILGLNYPKKSIEIIFVDNHSTDGTIKKIEEFQKENEKHYHSITLLVKKTNDPEARNVALQEAKGVFCLFWDTDMMLTEPNKLRKYVDYLQVHPHVGVVSCAGQLNLDQKNFYEKLMYGNTRGIFSLGFALFRRSVFDKVGVFSADTPTTCDLELASRMKKASIQMICDIDNPFLHVKKQASISTGLKPYYCYLRRAYHDGADYQYDLLLRTKDRTHLARIVAYALIPIPIVLSLFFGWQILLAYFAGFLLYNFFKFGIGKTALLGFLLFVPAGVLQSYGYIFTRLLGKPRINKKRYGYADKGDYGEQS